jgi:Holliday junction resolvase
MAVYVTRAKTLAELERFYRSELSKAGFEIVRSAPAGKRGVSLVVRGRGRDLAVVLAANSRGENVVSVETLA